MENPIYCTVLFMVYFASFSTAKMPTALDESQGKNAVDHGFIDQSIDKRSIEGQLTNHFVHDVEIGSDDPNLFAAMAAADDDQRIFSILTTKPTTNNEISDPGKTSETSVPNRNTLSKSRIPLVPGPPLCAGVEKRRGTTTSVVVDSNISQTKTTTTTTTTTTITTTIITRKFHEAEFRNNGRLMVASFGSEIQMIGAPELENDVINSNLMNATTATNNTSLAKSSSVSEIVAIDDQKSTATSEPTSADSILDQRKLVEMLLNGIKPSVFQQSKKASSRTRKNGKTGSQATMAKEQEIVALVTIKRIRGNLSHPILPAEPKPKLDAPDSEKRKSTAGRKRGSSMAATSTLIKEQKKMQRLLEQMLSVMKTQALLQSSKLTSAEQDQPHQPRPAHPPHLPPSPTVAEVVGSLQKPVNPVPSLVKPHNPVPTMVKPGNPGPSFQKPVNPVVPLVLPPPPSALAANVVESVVQKLVQSGILPPSTVISTAGAASGASSVGGKTDGVSPSVISLPLKKSRGRQRFIIKPKPKRIHNHQSPDQKLTASSRQGGSLWSQGPIGTLGSLGPIAMKIPVSLIPGITSPTLSGTNNMINYSNSTIHIQIPIIASVRKADVGRQLIKDLLPTQSRPRDHQKLVFQIKATAHLGLQKRPNGIMTNRPILGNNRLLQRYLFRQSKE